MMRAFNNSKWISLLLLLCFACQDEDQKFGEITTPTNVSYSFVIQGQDEENPYGDGSGLVDFVASAEDAWIYNFNFGDNSDNRLAPNGEVTHRFNQTGINTYVVTLIASGTGGASSTYTDTLTVATAFDDPEAKDLLSGGQGQSKTWYWAVSELGHNGVGPTFELDPEQYYRPAFFEAQPFTYCGNPTTACLCADELTFSQDMEGGLTYTLNNNGQTLFNAAHQAIVGGDGSQDQCFEFDTSFLSSVSLSPTEEDWSQVDDPTFDPRGTVLNFSDGGFMGYYIGSSTYEILEITSERLRVRSFDAVNPVIAWYHIFSTSPPNTGGDDCSSGDTGDEGSGALDVLVWAEEFDEGVEPCGENWVYDLGTGDNGWGNNEAQYYTDRPDNVVVEDGLLKITAKAESFEGSDYTSARIKTKEKFEFQYGKIEARIKLPSGGGTWPAFWMLGADIDTNPWPAAGEIDVMEHVGNNQNTIFASVHYPGNSGGDAITNSTVVEGVSDDFHIYSAEWTESEIRFYVDGNQYHSVTNTGDLPFNKDFFILLNVAMGGNFGGAIDPSFTESTMEVDYVRVYQ